MNELPRISIRRVSLTGMAWYVPMLAETQVAFTSPTYAEALGESVLPSPATGAATRQRITRSPPWMACSRVKDWTKVVYSDALKYFTGNEYFLSDPETV